jgi:tetratricopeptide (TPR) repeat protein
MSESVAKRGGMLRWGLPGLGLAVIIAGLIFSTKDVENAHSAAIRLVREGHLSEGLTLLEKHLLDYPDDIKSRKQLINFYLDEGNFTAAEGHLQTLVDVDDHREFALRTLAGQAVLLQDYTAAEKWLILLRQLFPQDYAAALAYGEVLHAQGRSAEAIPVIEQAVRLQPTRAETYLLLAEALNDAERTQEMIAPLEACLQLAPDLTAAHANLAFAYQAAGRAKDAIREANWCLTRDPCQTSIRIILAKSLKELGQIEEAWDHLQNIRKETPDFLEAALLEADILFFRGQSEQVYDHLSPFAKRHSDNRVFVNYMLRAAVAKKDRDMTRHWQRILEAMLSEIR